METTETRSYRLATLMAEKSGWFLLAIVVITAQLVVPLVAMAPEETASDNPGGRVYEPEERWSG